MITLYGIKNCDTVKKARNWLDNHAIEHHFHDFRSDGIDLDLLQGWTALTDWNSLLNRRSTTWKNLPLDTRDSLQLERALQLMLEQPTVIKRPVLNLDGILHIGFSEKLYSSLFNE